MCSEQEPHRVTATPSKHTLTSHAPAASIAEAAQIRSASRVLARWYRQRARLTATNGI